LDACGPLNRHDGIGVQLLDVPARSLKVATRVRIPLGLHTVGAANWPEPLRSSQRYKSWVVSYQEVVHAQAICARVPPGRL
jgi:hypothetical protein